MAVVQPECYGAPGRMVWPGNVPSGGHGGDFLLGDVDELRGRMLCGPP